MAFTRVQSAMTRSAIGVFLLASTVAHIAAGQATDFALRKFGSVAVSDAEVAQIVELAVSTGRRPWLLRSPHSMVTDLRIADLYLEPDVLGTLVQRGRMLALVSEGPRFSPPRSPWRIRDSYSYAYVLTPGRMRGEIRSERDSNWPFTVDGVFDDDTLISLVEFIRRQPRLPNVPDGQAPNQVSSAPISLIARSGDSVIVVSRTGDAQGERITMVRRNNEWVITGFEMWIV